jgi:hypothetical protein
METMFLISLLVTYLISIAIGIAVAQYYKREVTYLNLALILVLALIVFTIGQGTRIISIFDLYINLNWFLQGFLIGVLIKLALRMFMHKHN